MADKDGLKIPKNYQLDVPFGKSGPFYVKGAQDLDWGMKSRLASIFRPDSGNTVMFAFDHGYFMGSTAGLERLDLLIPRMAPYVDVLMGTRGAFRSCVPPHLRKGIALRCSAGSSILDDDLSHEAVAVEIDDALRLNASCIAVQTFIGAPGEKSSIENLSRVINEGLRYGVPAMGVVAVGKQMERTPRFFKLATRILAELGAQIIKTYYCPQFEEVAAACPVPLVVAGGKKIPEEEALELAYRCIQEGARGVDMGRNIFQSEAPEAMAAAINGVVHQNMTAREAYERYLAEKNSPSPAAEGGNRKGGGQR